MIRKIKITKHIGDEILKHNKYKITENSDATLTVYLHEQEADIAIQNRPTILVIPGGSYEMISEREAEPVAIEFYNMGFHAAILRYSVKEKARNMQPLKEAVLSIKLLREKAEEWNIISDKIAVCGFSAGGHLAGSTGVMWNEPRLQRSLDYYDNRYQPNALILCYPVITSGAHAHRLSFYNLSGSMEADREAEFYSLEKRVDENTPPTFIWHTQNDDLVPVENTICMINALQKYNISYEAHIFREGYHGISICTKEIDSENNHCRHWIKLCEEWLDDIFN